MQDTTDLPKEANEPRSSGRSRPSISILRVQYQEHQLSLEKLMTVDPNSMKENIIELKNYVQKLKGISNDFIATSRDFSSKLTEVASTQESNDVSSYRRNQMKEIKIQMNLVNSLLTSADDMVSNIETASSVFLTYRVQLWA